jgi:predicted DNA repair protein MutK
MDDVVVMSKIATKKQRNIRDDLAVNAEKHHVSSRILFCGL